MSWEDREDTTIYKVVVNHEEQYSIWPADRENALGWNDAGKSGTKAECLAYIEEVWTDMRPLSLRKKMQEAQTADQGQAESAGEGEADN
jgi:MbtH protein